MTWSPSSKSRHREKAAESENPLQTPLRTLDRICTDLSEVKRPALLDLGAPCSSNIDCFGEKGFKIFVEDFLRNYCEAGQRLSAMPQLLNYGPASFEGILCWDTFDFLHPDDAPFMAERLYTLLKPRGGLLALFQARDDGTPRKIFRHKITDGERILHEPSSTMRVQANSYQNREIMQIFSAFEIDKSYHHKSGYREYFFRKK